MVRFRGTITIDADTAENALKIFDRVRRKGKEVELQKFYLRHGDNLYIQMGDFE